MIFKWDAVKSDFFCQKKTAKVEAAWKVSDSLGSLNSQQDARKTERKVYGQFLFVSRVNTSSMSWFIFFTFLNQRCEHNGWVNSFGWPKCGEGRSPASGRRADADLWTPDRLTSWARYAEPSVVFFFVLPCAPAWNATRVSVPAAYKKAPATTTRRRSHRRSRSEVGITEFFWCLDVPARSVLAPLEFSLPWPTATAITFVLAFPFVLFGAFFLVTAGLHVSLDFKPP